MSESDKIYIIQPNYKLVIKNKRWTVNDAAEYLTQYYMKDDRFKTIDIANKKYQVTFDEIYKVVKTNIETSSLDVAKVYEHGYDDEGNDCNVLNLSRSTISPASFIVWAMMHDLPVPEVFKEILPFYKHTASSIDHKVTINDASIENKSEDDYGDEATDNKYPIYRDLKFTGLLKNDFDDLKRHYGMLRDEESKWRRAVAIAAKIGILFYERALNKPTTKPAFLAAYKMEFDATLQNDTLAKHIYSNLPESYQGVTKTPESRTDVDPIINAAVLAGAQSGDRECMNIKSFKKSLSIEGYETPSDDILEKIIAAVMKLEVEDNE